MISDYTAGDKVKIVEHVLKEGERVASVCLRYNISRKTLYEWIKRYQSAQNGFEEHAFASRIPKGQSHWKSLPLDVERKIIEIVRHFPGHSSKNLTNLINSQFEKPVVSSFYIQKLLERYGLNTLPNRLEYQNQGKKISRPDTIDRQNLVNQALSGRSVKEISQNHNVSRKLIYKWKNRYESNEFNPSALKDAIPKGDSHYKATSPEVKQKILDIVFSHPDWSLRQLAQNVPQVDGRPIIGYFGLQRLLEREGLNRQKSRLAWVGSQQADVPIMVPQQET
ncbi:MAG TPA: helix-turn-helix domain-containing protein, partial [Patescibacteria group bacterium]